MKSERKIESLNEALQIIEEQLKRIEQLKRE